MKYGPNLCLSAGYSKMAVSIRQQEITVGSNAIFVKPICDLRKL